MKNGEHIPPDVMASIQDDVCRWLRSGKSLLQYFTRPEVRISYETITHWREKLPEFEAAFSAARRAGCHVIADDALAIIDTEPGRVMPSGGYDSAEVTWRRDRFNARMQLLKSWNRHEYGDKQTTELTGANGGPVQVEGITVKLVRPDAG